MMTDGDIDDEDFNDEPPRFPVLVRLAGIAWIGVGSLSLLSAVLQVMLGGEANNAGQAAPGQSPLGGCCPLIFGVAFIAAGYNTVTGKAKDTLGNAIGSLAVGGMVLVVCITLIVVLQGAKGKAAAPGFGLGVPEMIVLSMLSMIYIIPGVLALVGRRNYLVWKKYHAPVERRRRRRDGDDD